MTPQFKAKRIYELIDQMDPPSIIPPGRTAGDQHPSPWLTTLQVAQAGLQAMLLSAVREANRMKIFKTRYVQSLLQSSNPTSNLSILRKPGS